LTQEKTSLFDQIVQRFGSDSNADRFVETMRHRMTLYGISKCKLAQASGYDVGTVRRWLNGRKSPRLQTRIVLSEALDDLVSGKMAA
jgi:transcriptional regulator with XRE-family HTH domain